ncbi:ribosome silencing factor [Myxococcota bacterium]|jgi:ribosome-associated protein|nr:ribosome silencing factor [Myxococcota bacterium]
MEPKTLAKAPRRTGKAPPLPDAFQEPRALAAAILEAAWSKNAYQTRAIQVGSLVDYTDIFLILTGRSDRHVRAIADEIEARMKQQGVLPLGIEGRQANTWILLDYGDVVVHVFEKSARDYYNLDHLWGEAPPIPVEEPVWVKDFARSEDSGDW